MTTPADIIARTRVPDTQSVFFLGCFERRVTLFSQQVRALNLVAAMRSEPIVRERGRIAVVGAGAAGLTAAVALARAFPDLRAIHLYEKRSELLELQQGSNRYLHPHNYDWPASSSSNVSAGLPFLNWRAGPADTVHRHLREQFEQALRGSSAMQFRPGTEIEGVRPMAREGARLLLKGNAYPSEIYDAVILSIGFGVERSIDGDTPPYWTISQAESPVLAAGVKDFFVSGNGDGGLVDFLGLAMQPMSHQDLCEFITGLDLGPAREELLLIEEEAWRPGADLDLHEAYITRVVPLLPIGLITEVGERLRPNVRVRLHTNETRLFKRDTAVLNRLGVTLALVADENRGDSALSTTVGVRFEDRTPDTGPIKLVGEPAFTPYRRILRIGPNSEANLRPFEDLVGRLPDAARRPSGHLRPSTPAMIAQVAEYFGTEAGPDSPASADGGASVSAVGVAEIRLERGGSGDLELSGDVPVAGLGEVWLDGRSVVVDCGLTPDDAPRLISVLARLCGHASSALVFSQARRRWETALDHAMRARALPGNLTLRIQVESARTRADVHTPVAMSPDAFVDAAHQSMDGECLRALDAELYDVIGRPDPLECGWPIEAGLRSDLWTLWGEWRQSLEADSVVLRRFLVLLAHETDFVVDPDIALVRVGPKTVRPHLLKSTLFALAFVVGSAQAMAPASAHPGNLHGAAGAGHACGVSWIDGRDVSSRVAERAWSTSLVLLSELQTALEFLRATPRLDEEATGTPRVGAIGPLERPLILGADEEFRDALERGRAALVYYLTSILEPRAEAAAAQIEGPMP